MEGKCSLPWHVSSTPPNRGRGTPETVKKFGTLAAEAVVARGAGLGVGDSGCRLRGGGARLRGDDVTKDADVGPRSSGAAEELKGYKKGALVIAIMDPYGVDVGLEADGGCRRHGLCHGADAVHYVGAVDGRACSSQAESGWVIAW